jgi:hypothetical protein
MRKTDLRDYVLEYRENGKALTMKFPVFSQVQLTQNIPQLNLKKGSVGTIIEYYPMSNSLEDGYSIEGLIYQDTVEVAESQIELIFTHQNREKVSSK